jgi:hypothetical protein
MLKLGSKPTQQELIQTQCGMSSQPACSIHMFSVACLVPLWSLLYFMASALLREGVESVFEVRHTYGILYYAYDRVVTKNMVGRERERERQLILG